MHNKIVERAHEQEEKANDLVDSKQKEQEFRKMESKRHLFQKVKVKKVYQNELKDLIK